VTALGDGWLARSGAGGLLLMSLFWLEGAGVHKPGGKMEPLGSPLWAKSGGDQPAPWTLHSTLVQGLPYAAM